MACTRNLAIRNGTSGSADLGEHVLGDEFVTCVDEAQVAEDASRFHPSLCENRQNGGCEDLADRRPSQRPLNHAPWLQRVVVAHEIAASKIS